MHSASAAEQAWRGALAVRVSLDSTELATLQAPRDVYLVVRRSMPLCWIAPQVFSAFCESVLAPYQANPQLWWDYGGLPLKPHLPVGTMYDLLTKSHLKSADDSDPSCYGLWSLTAHFSAVPDTIVPCDGGKEAAPAAFFHSLKEATYLQNGSSADVAVMPSAAQTQLFKAILDANIAEYRRIFKTHRRSAAKPESSSEGGGAAAAARAFYPIRLYVRTAREEDDDSTAASPSATDVSWADVETCSLKAQNDQSIADAVAFKLGPLLSSVRRTIVDGIDVDMSDSVAVLYRCISPPDRFLHIILVVGV